MRAFVRWLGTAIEIRHPLEIHATPRLFGYFDGTGPARNFEPYIIVSLDGNPLETIAHEIVHYEQWRDKRDITERGVEQRAKALVRRWRREAA